MHLKINKLMLLSALFIGAGEVAISIWNCKKIDQQNEVNEQIKNDLKSIVRYQEKNNQQFSSEIEDIRNEVSRWYKYCEQLENNR